MVVVAFRENVVGCCMVVDRVVPDESLREGMVALGISILVVEATVVAVSFTQAVVVSC